MREGVSDCDCVFVCMSDVVCGVFFVPSFFRMSYVSFIRYRYLLIVSLLFF